MPRRSPRPVVDPFLVVSGPEGNLFEVPDLLAMGRSGGTWVRPHPRSFRELPQGALLFHLPGRRPVGFDPRTGRPVVLETYRGREVVAAATFLPPAHTALFLQPWERVPGTGPLPLYAYCAVGFRDGTFVAPAVRVDPDVRQDVALFDHDEIEAAAARTLERFPGNRLVEHLVGNCALTYCCPAARNFVLGRWEAPIPTSPACNADCVGCLSFQPGREVPVTQPRLRLVPKVEEIAEMAALHLETAPRPVVSFGQGCEGEPLLQAELIEAAIREIRRRTARGTINLNSNASRPEAVARLVDAGLDSLRISINSCRWPLYEAYYRPRRYTLDDVVASGRAVASAGGHVSLNYFMFPGITDCEEEFAAFQEVASRAGARTIQMRNLNLDPDLYLASLRLPKDLAPGFGLDRWMKRAREAFPDLRFGYFNPPREDWGDLRRPGAAPPAGRASAG
jgi:pyruvate-formate lyase-activating enzyme